MIRNEKGEFMAAITVQGGAVRDSEELEVMGVVKHLSLPLMQASRR